jgi:hypothetical protein
MSLSACGDIIINQNCVGQNVICRTPSPTPNRPAIVATADAITQGQPLVSDPLSKEDNNRWANYLSDQKSCSFHDGAYFVTDNVSPAATYGCDSTVLNYSDAAIQMDVTLISGDTAGIIFRVDPSFSEMYAFDITNQREAELRMLSQNGISILIPATGNSAIHGVGKKNTLLVIARGDDFQLFVNATFVGEAHDDSLTTGYVGMSVSDYSESAKASFSNLVIYHV